MTIDELQALPDAELNALAAKLRGWTLAYSDHDSFRGVTGQYYFDGDPATTEAICAEGDWMPATDRNQSGELLQWAATQGCYFTISFGDFNSDVRARIDLERTQYSEREIFLDDTIPGNAARSETVAFCAAMMALEASK